MEDREHDYALGLDTVKDSIREARNEGAADVAVNTREHVRIALDRVKDRIRGREELFAKARSLALVVPESASEIPPNLRTVNNRKSH